MAAAKLRIVSSPDPQISWCDDPDEADGLIAFFGRNVPRHYSSHGSTPPRILGYDPWVSDEERNAEALRVRIATRPHRPIRGANVFLVVTAKIASEIVGMMVVTFMGATENPHVVLEDIVVSRGNLGHGIGSKMFQWIEEQAALLNYPWWLETSIDNPRAQAFFRAQGFVPRSLIMERPRSY